MTSKKSDLLQNHPLCWGILHLFCDFLAACVQNNVAWNGLKNELAISVKGGTVLFWYVVSFTSKMVMKECISVCIMLWFLFQFFLFACVLHFMSALVKMQNLFFLLFIWVFEWVTSTSTSFLEMMTRNWYCMAVKRLVGKQRQRYVFQHVRPVRIATFSGCWPASTVNVWVKRVSHVFEITVVVLELQFWKEKKAVVL